MVCWGRWRTINGKRVCIEDKSAKPVVIVAAILLASALTSGAVVGVSGVVATGAAAESIAAQSIQTRVTNSRSAARRGQSSEAWRRMGLRVVTRPATKEIRRELDCAEPSFGQVRKFFTRTPCRSMQRTQPELCDAHGNTLTVSITWVWMPTTTSAQRLQRLVDTDGTGNITSIAGGARFAGKHYTSRRTGSLVVVAEAATRTGWPAATLLDGVAEIAAEFPSPEG